MRDYSTIVRRKAASEAGATDPILVIAGIVVTLILLLGGVFAISGMISNAKNLNAKSDLDKIAVAEASFYAANDHYVVYDTSDDSKQALAESSIGFNPSQNTEIKVNISDNGNYWVAAVESDTGTVFYRWSEAQTIFTEGADDNDKGSADSEQPKEDLTNAISDQSGADGLKVPAFSKD